jgi:hypothetical protein
MYRTTNLTFAVVAIIICCSCDATVEAPIQELLNAGRRLDADPVVLSTTSTTDTTTSQLLLNVPTQSPPSPPPPAPVLTFESTPVPPPITLSPTSLQDGGPEDMYSSTFIHPDHPPPNYLAMCSIVRDAHPDISEWTHHHLKLGFSKLYIFDHGSIPKMDTILKHYIDQGTVVYIYFTEEQSNNHPSKAPQIYVYDMCLHHYGHLHEWMAFIDVDEFLMFRGGAPIQSLPLYLSKNKHLDNASGLAVHWILFGSSGYKSRPAGGLLRSYVKCMPLAHSQHHLVKSIIRPRCTSEAWSPHAFHHNCTNNPVVRTDGTIIKGPRIEDGKGGVFDQLVIHHYATKSVDEFEMKMARGSGMKRQRGWEYFNYVDAWSVEYCFDGVRIWNDDVVNFPWSENETHREQRLEKYRAEEHQEHWLRGGDNNGGGNNSNV